jgi:phage terminase small subunit
VTDKPLSERQLAFVMAYIGPAKGVASLAAKQAGYAGNEDVLGVQARRLLGNARVQQAIAEHRSKVIREGIATAEEVAVRLTAIGMGVATERRLITGKEGDFIEADVTMPGTTQVAALKALNAQMGYEAPTKSEVSGALALDVQLTTEQDDALAQWLRLREDPVIAARIAELEGA